MCVKCYKVMTIIWWRRTENNKKTSLKYSTFFPACDSVPIVNGILSQDAAVRVQFRWRM